MRETVSHIVITSLDDALQATSADPAEVSTSDDTPLIGRDSVLDSLGLVQLLADVEQRVQDEFGLMITVADDRAMSQRNSPFRTVAALTDYVETLIKEQSVDGRP
jgi:acyl carrier protein